MKKAFFLCSFCFVAVVYSQSFKFDLLTKYEIKHNDNKIENVIFSNSINHNYFLRVDTKFAILYEVDKVKCHVFEIVENIQNDSITYKFNYQKTTDVVHNNGIYKYEFEFLISDLDTITNFKTLKLKIFKNAKRKTPFQILTLKLKENDTNLFPVFRFACLHPLESLVKLDLPFNYSVEAGSSESRGDESSYKLLKNEKINFEIEITPSKETSK